MRKLTALLLAGGLLLTLSGCKKNSSQESSAPEPTPATEQYSEYTQPPATRRLTTAAVLPQPDTTEPTTASAAPSTYTEPELTQSQETVTTEGKIDKNGVYTSKDDVALYLYTYKTLPSNFITKKQAQAKGWSGGSLEPYAPGCCIGGTYFGNYEGLLPEKRGREYHECDIDTLGKKSRGAKRIVYSNDGLIYYTEDHYQTFELLYGEE
jgi:hypothetical protein